MLTRATSLACASFRYCTSFWSDRFMYCLHRHIGRGGISHCAAPQVTPWWGDYSAARPDRSVSGVGNPRGGTIPGLGIPDRIRAQPAASLTQPGAVLLSLPAEPATQEALRFRGESVAALATGVAEEVVGVDSELVQQVRVLRRI